jgi:hypothetical protein
MSRDGRCIGDFLESEAEQGVQGTEKIILHDGADAAVVAYKKLG